MNPSTTYEQHQHSKLSAPLPMVEQISRQYITAFTKFHVVCPLYDFIPVSIAACNSSSNFRSLVRAIDFQSSSLQMFHSFYFHVFCHHQVVKAICSIFLGGDQGGGWKKCWRRTLIMRKQMTGNS